MARDAEREPSACNLAGVAATTTTAYVDGLAIDHINGYRPGWNAARSMNIVDWAP